MHSDSITQGTVRRQIWSPAGLITASVPRESPLDQSQ